MDEKKIMNYALEAILSRYFREQKRAEAGSKIAENLASKYKSEIDFLHDKIMGKTDIGGAKINQQPRQGQKGR